MTRRTNKEVAARILSILPNKTTQDEWAELHPYMVQWFTDDCPLPLCRYRDSHKPRHHHLKNTLRRYERIMSADFPFTEFYRMELGHAALNERRRANRSKK